MKARFFLLDGASNASSVHRALQYFPLLAAHGIDATAVPPVPEQLYQPLMEGLRHGPRDRAAFYSLFLACRALAVATSGNCDVCVIQRDLFPFGPPLLERALRRVNSHIVYDTDDATYLRPAFTPDTLFQRWRDFSKVGEVIRHARWVTVATQTIADWALQFNPRVSVLPMAVDGRRYAAARADRPQRRGTLVLGWTGTGGGLRYLEALAPTLRDLTSSGQSVVRVISGAYASARLPGVAMQALPWRQSSELADLGRFDVGLVPLADSPFEQAKFPFKMLQFMALGIPVVAARVGVARAIIRHGENGLLAASPDEWRESLQFLLADRDARTRIGSAAVRTVNDAYTVDRVGPLLAEVLRQAAT